MKKLLFVFNPHSGTGVIRKHLSEVLDVFTKAGYEVVAYPTQCSGDGINKIREEGADFDRIVVAGGDGMLHEMVNGVMALPKEVETGYIATGTVNDFAATHGIPKNVVEAAKIAASDNIKALDLGKFGDKYFSYIASFGAFTRASYATPQSLKNTMGHMAYILEGIKEISQIQPYRVHMELDGRTLEDDFLFVGMCNATSIAGVLTLDKSRVDMSDGLFEVLLVRAPKSLSELSDCINGLRYGDFDSYMVKLYRASKIEVRTTPKASWSLDGEMALGADSILVENLPKRLVIVH